MRSPGFDIHGYGKSHNKNMMFCRVANLVGIYKLKYKYSGMETGIKLIITFIAN